VSHSRHGHARRRPNVVPKFQGQHGKCCWCGGPLIGRQRSWCGAKCVNEYHIAKGDQGRAREILFKRDAGKCAICSMDTDQWEADHTVPIVEGGALTIENLRTLCVPCHRSETRKLRARMSAKAKEGAATC
jgi:5-methylcytosine-specific restriction protein A